MTFPRAIDVMALDDTRSRGGAPLVLRRHGAVVGEPGRAGGSR